MRKIIHEAHGDAVTVLTVVQGDDAPTSVGAGEALVRVKFAPIHQGDLLGIAGSTAFGTNPPNIPQGGRIPGFEGVGWIEKLGADTDGFEVGDRVAFFPANGTWRDSLVVPASSLVRVPPEIEDEVAAQMLINTATAMIILRTGHNAVPSDKLEDVTVVQTGAASAVGRLVTRLLLLGGVRPIRIVRSVSSAEKLKAELPDVAVVATQAPDFREDLETAIGGRDVFVGVDGVGGPAFEELSRVVAEGGTIVNYGSLGGEGTDIRLIVPRSQKIVGITVGTWGALDEETRRSDIQTALKLAADFPQDFPVGGIYTPDRIEEAMAASTSATRTGTVLLDFRSN
ncbi:zinc-binding dehydrogenase [Rhizobium sp. S152]|uniref:alcohol dehydrogenase catalytic domain-containing protein n=1 Tax=Rhizobium sp. S152 TaxID=3055038 RepID=UPI0025A954E4|nr:zinc-binding dehydrogenase [Rhizobium sp. S152]MDM9628505.1 zinc-binding dehydrogenase [Rhizobium sp. S152]